MDVKDKNKFKMQYGHKDRYKEEAKLVRHNEHDDTFVLEDREIIDRFMGFSSSREDEC